MSLCSLLKNKNNKYFFTTPSHSGDTILTHKFYNWYRCDISETDTLKPQEALLNSEKWAAKIYGVKYTKYLTNGSTSGIMASVLTCAKNKSILIWDKAHQSHKNAAKLCNCNIIEYSLKLDEQWGCYLPMTPEETETLITKHNAEVIIITSPTYEGFVSNIQNISEICKKYNVKLIIDEAHGALYPFSDKLPESAVLYADYTIQSLHKTAGGINPTALIHSNDADISEALDIINTTSPSYPMLATIENNIRFLASKRGQKKINELICNIEVIHKNIKNIEFGGEDITKILIKKEGFSGYQLSKVLYDKYNIEDERTNNLSTMLLCGIGTTKTKLKKLEQSLKNL